MSEHKERPTFEFHFHDKVGQNIANVEHMEVHFDKNMQMQVQNVEEMNASANKKEETESKRDDAPPSTRGPRKKYLFIKEGDDTKEAEQVKNREKNRLCEYLSRHCLKGRALECTKDSTLNKTVVCFLLKWMERGMTAEQPSGGAIFRFLTDDCGIVSDVQEKAYSNRVKEWIKDTNGYDAEVMLKVKDAFK